MMNPVLTDEEATLLADVLSEYLSELRSEIRDTDDHEFKGRLKAKEAVLRGVVSKLEPSLVTEGR
jgi:hypothetical protein